MGKKQRRSESFKKLRPEMSSLQNNVQLFSGTFQNTCKQCKHDKITNCQNIISCDLTFILKTIFTDGSDVLIVCNLVIDIELEASSWEGSVGDAFDSQSRK